MSHSIATGCLFSKDSRTSLMIMGQPSDAMSGGRPAPRLVDPESVGPDGVIHGETSTLSDSLKSKRWPMQSDVQMRQLDPDLGVSGPFLRSRCEFPDILCCLVSHEHRVTTNRGVLAFTIIGLASSHLTNFPGVICRLEGNAEIHRRRPVDAKRYSTASCPKIMC
jgi:hypothetical protein